MKNEIHLLNKKILLLSEIYQQTEIYLKKINRYVVSSRSEINCLINSFKVLFIRKICNYILDNIYIKYKDSLAFTEREFVNSENSVFNAIVAKDDIAGINKYKINLLLDFLIETKRKCSRIIHINEDDVPVIKEIFFSILDKGKIVKENEFILNIQDMTYVLFNDNVIKNEKSSNKYNKVISFLNNYLNNEGEDLTEESLIQEENIAEDSLNGQDKEEDYFKKIKKVISGEKNNIDIKELLEILKEKLYANQIEIDEHSIASNEIMNANYFYNSWKNSFINEDYKKTNGFKKFVNISNITSMDEMKNQIIILLPNFKINFFSEEPKFKEHSKNIQTYISGYGNKKITERKK